MQIYLVGGAVRDELLGIKSHDQDYVVVGATPQMLLDQGYQQVGADFPVFLHPDSKQEYALARTERKSGHGYQGFSCDFSPDIRLEDDLKRRDLTINAMARDEAGELVDPFGGQADLSNKILRHVSPAFVEDPLRVLRVARFAARFKPLGFRLAPETLALMQDIATSGELSLLTPERVWQETVRALMEAAPEEYISVLHKSHGLKDIMPEVECLFGVPQPAQHHPEIDTGIHLLLCLRAAAATAAPAEVRFALLCHDLGKGITEPQHWPHHHGHEQLGVKEAARLCQRLKAPNNFRQLALLVCQYHSHCHRAFELKPTTLLKTLKALDALRRPERFEQFLQACELDALGRAQQPLADADQAAKHKISIKNLEQLQPLLENPYPQANYLRQALKCCQQVSGAQLKEEGLSGAALGQVLDQRRLAKLAELKKSSQLKK